MNNLNLPSESGIMGVGLQPPSSSVSPYLAEEDASQCLLLSTTPSPPPMDFTHPLTPSTGNEENCNELAGDDARIDSSSMSGSSGIGMDVPVAGTTTLYNNKNVYQNLDNNGESIQQNGGKQYANLNIQITKDTPGFVHWNWPLIRKCSFIVFMAGVFAMASIVVALIASLPRACNPRNVWYKGAVFYEIFPASYQDSNNDGYGDLSGLSSRLPYLQALGVTAVRLNSIFPSTIYYPDHFENVSSLVEIDNKLGGTTDFAFLVKSLHERNMTLVLDLPIYPLVTELGQIEHSNGTTGDDIGDGAIMSSRNKRNVDNILLDAMKMWLGLGVDGFYVKGLENLRHDPYLVANVIDWKTLLGKDRVLIVSEKLLADLNEATRQELLLNVDLVDVYIDVRKGTSHVLSRINDTILGTLAPAANSAQAQWSIGGVSEHRLATEAAPNSTLAATMLTLLLPGATNIFYGDEIALQETRYPADDGGEYEHVQHLPAMTWQMDRNFTSSSIHPWIRQSASQQFSHVPYISDLIKLRKVSPSIYQNGVCKKDHMEPNTSLKYSSDDILVIERWYPRRQSFVSITNFGMKKHSLDLSSMFYGGEDVSGRYKDERVVFNEFKIGPSETVVVRLDK